MLIKNHHNNAQHEQTHINYANEVPYNYTAPIYRLPICFNNANARNALSWRLPLPQFFEQNKVAELQEENQQYQYTDNVQIKRIFAVTGNAHCFNDTSGET